VGSYAISPSFQFLYLSFSFGILMLEILTLLSGSLVIVLKELFPKKRGQTVSRNLARLC
jgi:hypothetical protein